MTWTAADRTDVEALMRKVVAEHAIAADADALVERVRDRMEELAATAAAEYRAYRAAAGTRTGGDGKGAAPGLAAAVAAAVSLGLDFAHGLSAGAAVVTGAATGAATFGAAVLRNRGRDTAGGTGQSITAGTRTARPAEVERARRAWLTALERRGIRPFVAKQRAAVSVPPPSEKPPPPAAAQVPPPRRSAGADRSAAARTRAVLEQSFGSSPGRRKARSPGGGPTSRGSPSGCTRPARRPAYARPSCVLHGAPGSGRTTLAVRAARQLKDQFRGACVVDLRGAARPRTAAGPRRAAASAEPAGRAPRPAAVPRAAEPRPAPAPAGEQYQQHLTGVPVVIVLDDATDAAQVRPLVPERSESAAAGHRARTVRPGAAGRRGAQPGGRPAGPRRHLRAARRDRGRGAGARPRARSRPTGCATCARACRSRCGSPAPSLPAHGGAARTRRRHRGVRPAATPSTGCWRCATTTSPSRAAGCCAAWRWPAGPASAPRRRPR